MARHDVPEAGQPVEILLAIGIGEDGSFALDPHVAGLVSFGVVKRVDQVCVIADEQLGVCHHCFTTIDDD